MAHGKACISTKEAGIPDIVVNGETGRLIEKQDASALANAVESLEKDETICRKMGEEGRKRYESCYTLNSFGQSITEIMMCNIMQADILYW